MKPKHGILFLIPFVALAASARQPSKSIIVVEDESSISPTVQDYPSNPDAVTIDKEYDFSKPLNLEGPRHESVRADDRESQAWASSVGWRPGESQVPDPITHEPKLKLFSIPFEKTPKNR